MHDVIFKKPPTAKPKNGVLTLNESNTIRIGDHLLFTYMGEPIVIGDLSELREKLRPIALAQALARTPVGKGIRTITVQDVIDSFSFDPEYKESEAEYVQRIIDGMTPEYRAQVIPRVKKWVSDVIHSNYDLVKTRAPDDEDSTTFEDVLELEYNATNLDEAAENALFDYVHNELVDVIGETFDRVDEMANKLIYRLIGGNERSFDDLQEFERDYASADGVTVRTAAINVVDEAPESHSDAFFDTKEPGVLESQDTAFPPTPINNDPDGASPWAWKRRRSGSLLRKEALTLWHGTTLEAAQSIMQEGLHPQIGEWTESAYRENIFRPVESLTDTAFATDVEQMEKALGGVVAQVAAELGKEFLDVTDDEILEYGALIKINDGERYFSHVPEPSEYGRTFEETEFEWEELQEEGEISGHVEAGDWFTDETVPPQALELIQGKKMLLLFRRAGDWPRMWGPDREEGVRQRWVEDRMRTVDRDLLKEEAEEYYEDEDEVPSLSQYVQDISEVPAPKDLRKQLPYGPSHHEMRHTQPYMEEYDDDSAPPANYPRRRRLERDPIVQDYWRRFKIGPYREARAEAELQRRVHPDEWKRVATPQGWELGDLTDAEDNHANDVPIRIDNTTMWNESYHSDNQYEDPSLKLGMPMRTPPTSDTFAEVSDTGGVIRADLYVLPESYLELTTTPEDEIEHEYVEESVKEGWPISLGFVSARATESEFPNIYTIRGAQVQHGYGPLVYDLVLEAAARNGVWVTPDRRNVTADALRVWDFYFANRSDVEKEPLPDGFPVQMSEEPVTRYMFRKPSQDMTERYVLDQSRAASVDNFNVVPVDELPTTWPEESDEVVFALESPDGQHHGFMQLSLMRDNMGRPYGRITGVSLSPKLQGRGLGRKMYDAALDFVNEHNAWLRSDTAVSDAARAVWHRLRRDPSISKRLLERRSPPIVNEDPEPGEESSFVRDWSRTMAPELHYEYRTASNGQVEELPQGHVAVTSNGKRWVIGDSNRFSAAEEELLAELKPAILSKMTKGLAITPDELEDAVAMLMGDVPPNEALLGRIRDHFGEQTSDEFLEDQLGTWDDAHHQKALAEVERIMGDDDAYLDLSLMTRAECARVIGISCDFMPPGPYEKMLRRIESTRATPTRQDALRQAWAQHPLGQSTGITYQKAWKIAYDTNDIDVLSRFGRVAFPDIRELDADAYAEAVQERLIEILDGPISDAAADIHHHKVEDYVESIYQRALEQGSSESEADTIADRARMRVARRRRAPQLYRWGQAEHKRPRAVVDLDGTLLEPVDYDAPRLPSGQPALSAAHKGASGAMGTLQELGWEVIVATARFSKARSPEQTDHMLQEIKEHLQREGIHFDEITTGPKPIGDVYIDDRAKKFDGDWWKVIKEVTRQAYLKPDKHPGESAVFVVPVPLKWPDVADNGPAHLTLAYLLDGPFTEEEGQQLTEIGNRVASQSAPFSLTFKPGVSWFENAEGESIAHKEPEEGRAELTELAEALRDELKAEGFNVSYDDQPFKAHVTLAYCDGREYEGEVPEGEFTVDNMVLWGFEPDPKPFMLGRFPRGGAGLGLNLEGNPNDWTNPTYMRNDLSVDPRGGREQLLNPAPGEDEDEYE